MKLTIESLANNGSGIAHAPDGRVCFVERALPQDVCLASIVKEHQRWMVAKVDEKLTSSPLRQSFVCPYHAECSGCLLGELSYDEQLLWKKHEVENAFSHVSNIELNCSKIFPSPERVVYRNKIELSREKCGSTYKLGFYGNNFVPISNCPAFQGPDTLIPMIEGALNYLQNQMSSHVYRVTLRSSKRTGETEVALWTETGPFDRGMTARVLKDTSISSLVRIQTKGSHKARRIVNVERLSGKGSWSERVNDHTYKVSAPSFFQVNTKSFEQLISFVNNNVQAMRPERALDLYCGVGTFTLPLAKNCNEVYAIEAEKTAVRDLSHNVEKANLSNVHVIGGDVGKQLRKLAPHLILVDPPRSGLSSLATNSILANEPEQLIYVSCNPITLARDAKLLIQNSYKAESLTAFDLFPNTPHVEAILILSRRQ